jgi:hypothetical protein
LTERSTVISDLEKGSGHENILFLIEIGQMMDDISKAISQRSKELDADVMTTRRDPTVKKLWDKLCTLHTRALSLCEEYEDDGRPSYCARFERPQACIEVLHLAEEETCCSLNIRQMEMNRDTDEIKVYNYQIF